MVSAIVLLLALASADSDQECEDVDHVCLLSRSAFLGKETGEEIRVANGLMVAEAKSEVVEDAEAGVKFLENIEVSSAAWMKMVAANDIQECPSSLGDEVVVRSVPVGFCSVFGVEMFDPYDPAA
jgi:hypothetical protein